jgi:hypothetical protein
MSAWPDEAASKLSKAPTSSPAALASMVSVPPVRSATLLTTRSTESQTPARPRGQVVTMVSCSMPWLIAGAASDVAATAPPPSADVFRNERRSIILTSPFVKPTLFKRADR